MKFKMAITKIFPYDPWGGSEDNSADGSKDSAGNTPESKIHKMPKKRKKSGGSGGGFGGGFGGNMPELNFDFRTVVFVTLAVIGVWLFSGVYRIQEGEQGALLRFGRWQKTVSETGLGWHIPAPIETITIKKITEIKRINIGISNLFGSNHESHVFMLTGDENILDVNMTIFWYITDLKKYLFRAADPELTVRIAAESAVREVIAQTSMELALTKGKSEIVLQVQKLLQGIVDEYQIGIEISKVDLQKVDAPGPVIDAFRDVQSARADQERIINEATGYRDSVLPKARGDAARIVQASQAEHDRLIAGAEGEAEHFSTLYKEYKQAPQVTKRRIYLHRMGEIMSRINKVIVDDRSSKVLPYVPLPSLNPQKQSEGKQ